MAFSVGDIAGRVLHDDGDLVILDKPGGLPVHAGAKIQQHLEELLDGLTHEVHGRPRLAHRLDKDTSGCLVLGRHDAALVEVGRLFRLGKVGKVYWAVTIGIPAVDAGTIDLPLLKVAGETGARMVVDDAGKTASTDYRVVTAGAGFAWLELRPRTGRTHQLRAHCAALGTPILGDPIYGPERPAPCPLHLHARTIRIPFQDGRRDLAVTAPLPAAMAATFAARGWNAGEGRMP